MRGKRVMVGAFALLLLVACGGQAPAGGGNDGNGQTPVANPQDLAAALSAASSQLYRLERPLITLVPVPVLGLAPFTVGVAPLDTVTWDCSPVTVTGNASDPDRDGIPVNATYDGRCTWSYSGSESAKGYWEYQKVNVQDPDSNDPQAGVRVKGVIKWGATATAAGSVNSTWTITRHDLVRKGDAYKFDYAGSWVVTLDRKVYTFNYDLSGTWTPDDMKHPWDNGTLSAEGRFSGNGPDCANGWTLDARLSGVHFTAEKIDAGKAYYSGTGCDGKAAAASVSWSATQVCITVKGKTVCAPND